MIIRDEEITKLSVDMKESERFEFTKNTIIAGDFDSLITKAQAILELLKKETTIQEKKYNSIREKVSNLTTRISELRSEALTEGDIKKATTIIEEIADLEKSDESCLLRIANQKLVDYRIKRDALHRIQIKLKAIKEKQIIMVYV